MVRFAIACGGSGGHLSPGVAIAEGLTANGHECSLIVSQKDVDDVMSSYYSSFKCFKIPALPVKNGVKGIFKFLSSQFDSFRKCRKLLKDFDCLIGMGGFTSVPAAMAAFSLKKKIALHEANRIMGKATKVLAPLADIIFLPEDVVFKSKRLNKKVINARVPLRNNIVKIDKSFAKESLGLQKEIPVITILGGSQGAKPLNQWAYENLMKLNREGFSVCCVQRPKSTFQTIEGRTSDGRKVINLFFSFCNDMSTLLSATDVIICRSGASTIEEANYFSLPMILIPYPHAAGNHQDANARYVEKKGAAIVVNQECMDTLLPTILKLAKNNFSTLKNFDSIEDVCKTKLTILSALESLVIPVQR